MFSAKTSKMLMMLEKHKYQNKQITLFKPTLDNRYSESNVVSHAGWAWPAITIKTGQDIIQHLADMESNPSVVALDEAFMVPGCADVMIWLFRNAYDLVVSSLDLSATCKPFSEVQNMLPWATYIEKCSAVCSTCGNDAFYSYKKVDDDLNEISVGGGELYEPRCAACHPLVRL
jgi:thymidine kinase